MLHIAWFTWPKMLASYFILMGFYAYLRFVRLHRESPDAAGRWFLAFWAWSLLGCLTHQVAAVYIAAILLHAAYRAGQKRCWPFSGRTVALAVVLFGIILVPWYGWVWVTFGPE